jgi:spore maturation protein CgeB
MNRLRIVILGLSITSSWGNGHATTYRGLVKELRRLGHTVTFLERDVPWYAAHRDVLPPSLGDVFLYADLDDLAERFSRLIRIADAVILGSFVPEGSLLLRWILDVTGGAVAFYDIDTPVTVAKLNGGEEGYVTADLLRHIDLYLSFTGGPLLERIRRDFGVRRTEPLYCGVDPDVHRPVAVEPVWAVGYLGTYSADRQPKVERLLNEPARRLPTRRFVVAGPQYPPDLAWPANVERIEHMPPDRHRNFYGAQHFTLNVTRADMVAAGWSPSVRLFEAAACGTPIISDHWPGLCELFRARSEILIAADADDVLSLLCEVSEEERRSIGEAARRRVLASHTAACRAKELEDYLLPLCRLSSSRPAMRDEIADEAGDHGPSRIGDAPIRARRRTRGA